MVFYKTDKAYVPKMTRARSLTVRDRERGVCQSVRDETEADSEVLMGLETASIPRRQDRAHIPECT